jgi:hypothetical protein
VGLLVLAIVGGAAADQGARIAIGRVSISGTSVERSTDGRFWTDLEEGALLRTGERMRCGATSVARVGIGWASLILSPDSEIAIPASTLLSIHLDNGRIEERSEGADIVKINTPECLVRGKGHIVVRRVGEITAISARMGRFRVVAGRHTVRLEPGMGTVVRKGHAPLAPHPLAPAPTDVTPGPDPTYIESGSPVRLEWSSKAKEHWLELIAVGTEAVVFQRLVGAPPALIAVPWPGTYRWRVAVRDDLGMDGEPSRSGLICVPGL